MSRPVVARRLTEIRPDEALAAGTLIHRVWPRPDRGPVERAEQLTSLGATYDGSEERGPESALVFDADRVIAHALSFARTVQTTDGPVTVLALAMVASDPDYRGQGLGDAVVRAAFERVDSGAFPLCLYQTSFPVERFYQRFGACRVENRILNSQHGEDQDTNPFWDDLVMRYPATAPWPGGDVDLCGPGY
ncbi:MAG: GNAT family N-acetyltransferase [Planctomycetota bacterium]